MVKKRFKKQRFVRKAGNQIFLGHVESSDLLIDYVLKLQVKFS